MQHTFFFLWTAAWTCTIFSIPHRSHRLPFSGIPRFHDLSEVAGNAQRVCLTTHAAPVCVAACVALAAVVAQLLQGATETADGLEEALRTAFTLASQYVSEDAERAALEDSLLGRDAEPR